MDYPLTANIINMFSKQSIIISHDNERYLEVLVDINTSDYDLAFLVFQLLNHQVNS